MPADFCSFLFWVSALIDVNPSVFRLVSEGAMHEFSFLGFLVNLWKNKDLGDACLASFCLAEDAHGSLEDVMLESDLCGCSAVSMATEHWSADVSLHQLAEVNMHWAAEVQIQWSADVCFDFVAREALFATSFGIPDELSLSELDRYRIYEIVHGPRAFRSFVLLGASVKSRMAYLSNKELNRRKHAENGNPPKKTQEQVQDGQVHSLRGGAQRPYRWWKARAAIAENARWGKRRMLWQRRLGACAQDEAWWRGENARYAIRMEEAQALEAKKLERRRLARERRRERVAAARVVAVQAEEARRSSARASRLESLAAFLEEARRVPKLREPARAICSDEASSATSAENTGSHEAFVAQKQRLDVFFQRRCARADSPCVVGRCRRPCSQSSSDVVLKGTADAFWLLRFFSFMQFVCLPL